jgi:hypothetical protein
MKAAPVLVAAAFALACGSAHAQQKKGKLPPPDFAEARRQYCKGHEAMGALGFLRHRAGRDADALPLVIQHDFRNLRGADLRMRIWTLNYGMNVAASEQEAKSGAFKHCVEGFGPVLEQMRAGPLR